MGRVIGGIAAGIVSAFLTVLAVEYLGHALYPLPSDLDTRDFEALGAYVETLPAGALLFVLLAWFLGALDGALVAGLVSRRHWTVWLIAALVALAGIANVMMIPHPALLQIGSVAAPLLGGLAASLVVRRSMSAGGGA